MGNIIDTTPFAGIELAFQVKSDGTIDLGFNNVPLDVLADFLDFMGTDQGQDVLGDALIRTGVQAGLITPGDIGEVVGELLGISFG